MSSINPFASGGNSINPDAGSTSAEDWSVYPAIQDVDLGGFTLRNGFIEDLSQTLVNERMEGTTTLAPGHTFTGVAEVVGPNPVNASPLVQATNGTVFATGDFGGMEWNATTELGASVRIGATNEGAGGPHPVYPIVQVGDQAGTIPEALNILNEPNAGHIYMGSGNGVPANETQCINITSNNNVGVGIVPDPAIKLEVAGKTRTDTLEVLNAVDGDWNVNGDISAGFITANFGGQKTAEFQTPGGSSGIIINRNATGPDRRFDMRQDPENFPRSWAAPIPQATFCMFFNSAAGKNCGDGILIRDGGSNPDNIGINRMPSQSFALDVGNVSRINELEVPVELTVGIPGGAFIGSIRQFNSGWEVVADNTGFSLYNNLMNIQDNCQVQGNTTMNGTLEVDGIINSNAGLRMSSVGQTINDSGTGTQMSSYLQRGGYNGRNWAVYDVFSGAAQIAKMTIALDKAYFATAQHPVRVPVDYDERYYGLILSSRGEYINKPEIQEAHIYATVCEKEKDKNVYGVFSKYEFPIMNENPGGNQQYSIYIPEKTKEYGNIGYVNSAGEGMVWCCNIKGKIEKGDYLTSSPICGVAMRQDDDLLHNYTILKSAVDCDFKDHYSTYPIYTLSGNEREWVDPDDHSKGFKYQPKQYINKVKTLRVYDDRYEIEGVLSYSFDFQTYHPELVGRTFKAMLVGGTYQN